VAADPLTTVGSVDNLVYSGNSGDSDADETAFFAAYLGLDPDDVDYTKIDLGGEDEVWHQVDGFPNLWMFDFQPYVTNPTYFLVKLGNATFSHFIYENVGSMRYGVIDLGDFDATSGNISILSVSHVATATKVQEPGTLALLGLGLAAVVFGRRYAVS
jgi:hypothetical protein